MKRPFIVMPARFSASASALRYGADVMSRRLMSAVYAAGGEPVVIHPVAPVTDSGRPGAQDVDAAAGVSALPTSYLEEVAERVRFADGFVLPGGGDVSPVWVGEAVHDTHYDMDVEQDAFDFALAQVALQTGTPTLAICRGMQVVNLALGGSLNFDMATELGIEAHRHRVETIAVEPDSRLARVLGSQPSISCYHHQSVKDLAPGWRVVARSSDKIIEAMETTSSAGHGSGITAIQWHPEDNYDSDPAAFALFTDLVKRSQQRDR